MADPRTHIVKPCPPAYLGKSAASISQSAASRRNLTNAAGKLGDLEVLNSAGAGDIGKGLRTLASVSNTIRQGCGSLPTSLGGALGSIVNSAEAEFTAGTDWVLSQMNMGYTTVEAVRAFNPGAANQAQGQAQQIYNQVRQGNFKASDIPNALQDFQNLERLARQIYTPPKGDHNSSLHPQCEASAYALDLIARQPKQKFMFIVQFIPSSGYADLTNLDVAFMVHESTRPSIKYQMEDINFYNFHSKVITKTEFEPMTMTFYDDIRNDAGRFHAAVLKALTPIANYPTYDEFGMTLAGRGRSTESPEDRGMLYDVASDAIDGVSYLGRKSTASIGPLNNISGSTTGNITLFREIKLYHVFDGGRKMNIYSCYNPRITDLKLDALSMAESATTNVELSFAYDTCYIDTNVSFEDGKLARSAQASSAGIANSALYSLQYYASPSAAKGPNKVPPEFTVPFGENPAAACDVINTDNPTPAAGRASRPAVQSPPWNPNA
jgi:hypothetical protein